MTSSLSYIICVGCPTTPLLRKGQTKIFILLLLLFISIYKHTEVKGLVTVDSSALR